ncbi:MAG: hypothetical protein HKN47_03205, partial [Pirellulaceae bacterium]|nr:hypothetical protein [Pirellulaceae bacterium]
TNVALESFVGDQFFAGFTASNWDRPNAHRILSWSLSTDTLPVDPPADEIRIVSSSINVNEAAGFATIELIRTGDVSDAATVDYRTLDQSAQAGQDYTSVDSTATFLANESTIDVLVPIIDDNDAEPTESFTFQIDNPSGADLGVPSSTTITIFDNEQPLPSYANFQNQSGIKTNGGASIAGDALQLTSAATFQTGSAFFDTAISINGDTSFQSEFSFEMTGGSGASGADGILFVLQNSAGAEGALGRGGSGLGYDGIGNSIAIELDTWKNGWDVYSDEVGVVASGDIKNQLAQAQSPVNLNSGDVYHAWVDYDGSSDTLSVYVSQDSTKPSTPVVQTNVALESFVGDQFFAGFTASNWDRPNAHRILSWSLNLETPDVDPPGGIDAISIADSTITVFENDGFATVQLVRGGDLVGAATIDYQTFDQSAVAGEDYTTTNNTATFDPNESTIDILIPISDDDETESTEAFTFTIDNPSGSDLGVPRTATITIIDDEQPLPNYSDFQNSAGLVTNGGASILGDKLQITNDAVFQTGSAFFDTAIDIDSDTSFQTAFSFEMTGGLGTGGADGILFVLQNSDEGPDALGRVGSGLGYDGIGNSIAIELDTWQNAWDQYNDEVGVVADGDIQNQLAQVKAPFNLNFGGVYYAWVDYNGTSDTLSVYVSQDSTKPTAATLQINVELDQYVGDQFYAGFTASNWDRPNAHRILSWSLNLETPIDPPVNPSGDVVGITVASGYVQPTAIDWSPDGRNMYVAEKSGIVKVVRDGNQLTTPVIDISNVVNNVADRGLLDIAIHPDLQNNPYLYLLYAYDPPEVYDNQGDAFAGPDKRGNRAGRLMRVELS